jgi:hypothetical protein
VSPVVGLCQPRGWGADQLICGDLLHAGAGNNTVMCPWLGWLPIPLLY